MGLRLRYTESIGTREQELPRGVFVIGRATGCAVRIANMAVSKLHCEGRVVGDVLLVRDLGSRNGTWINGARVGTGFVPVGMHDSLQLGRLRVSLHLVEAHRE